MLSLICFGLSLFLFLACWLVWQARVFAAREAAWREREAKLDADWRERERLLVDRLLRQAKVEPIASRVEVENVIKYPDPELPPLDFAGQLLMQDMIKEELETRHPGLAHLPLAVLQGQHAREWDECRLRVEAAHTPLRVA